ncbi:Sensory/regulatory protein RpfC [Planctomyces sp. SH-PL14]|nr:Sensory/regulatory protein RpfC [Planctomyces sp. SH-PL14]
MSVGSPPIPSLLTHPTGEMRERIRGMDWSRTALGPRESWPAPLRMAVDLILDMPVPAAVLWGPDLIQIYNDGYAVIAGGKHPGALGLLNAACWPEVQEVVRPLYERVLKGEPIFVADLPLTLARKAVPEQVHLSVAYTPLRQESGEVCGILAVLSETTELVRTEQRRQQAERERLRLAEQQRLALEAAQMGWWHYDVEQDCVHWDERLQAMFGIERADMKLEDVLAYLSPDDAEKVAAALRTALDPASTVPYRVEYRVRRPDGTRRWLQSRGQALKVGEGAEQRVVGIYGTALDITETKESDTALRTAAARLNLALEAGHLGTWEWDARSDAMTLSPRARRLYGVADGVSTTRAEVRQLLQPEHRELARQKLEEIVRTKGEYEIEYALAAPRSDSAASPTWLAARGRCIFNSAGDVVGMIGVVQDITPQKQYEDSQARRIEEIDSERARLSAAFQKSPAFMCVLRGPEHVFEFVNDQYSQLVGERDLIGLPVLKALPEIEGQGYLELLDRVLASGQRYVGRDMSVSIQRKPGEPLEERFIDFVYQPLTAADGQATGIFVHGVDSTEMKQGLQERERLLDRERTARADAERANKMKDEFLSTLSHELRTPLNAILGWAQVLRANTKDPAALAEGLETIERNALSQTKIIEDLLDMSRIISGKVRLDVQRVDLAEVIRTGVETVRPAAEGKGVRITTVLDPLAGPVVGDPDRLQQVVWNLLNNAVKFTPRDGRVQVALERVNSHIEMSVMDTGIGIAPEFLPHVFDRFRQADSSTTRRHSGLGLGLAIVRQLVELHGGSVRVKSPGIDQGSTFTVALPMSAVHPDPAPERERFHPRSQKISDPEQDALVFLPGVRVLVVDDEPDARTLIRKILEDCDARVTTAGSAVEAMELIFKEQFDVLVSDIGMPDVDGYRLIRRIRKLTPEQGGTIPALALTAFARSEDRMRAIRCGFNMHISKPVERAELVTMVASLSGASGTP